MFLTANSEEMNISSEIFPTDGSNSSDHFFFNTTEEEIGFNMFSTVHFITVLLGVPMNTYVIWLIVTGTGNGIAAEFFTLNLSICEMFFCLESLLIILCYEFNILLKAVYFLDGIATTSRPLFQCLMCVERYLAVVHPVTFLKFKPLRYRVICSVFVWTLGLGSSLITMITFHSYNIYVFTWFSQFLLFLSIQLFCCVAVLRALKQSGPGERGRERGEKNHMKRRAFYLILLTTVSMVIMYVPFIVIGMLITLTQLDVSLFSVMGTVCYIVGGFVQPVLYLRHTGKLSCFCSYSNLLATGIYCAFCCKFRFTK